jgi:hypothetical protein
MNKNWKPLLGVRMYGLTNVRQVWNRTKFNRLECATHKNVRANSMFFLTLVSSRVCAVARAYYSTVWQLRKNLLDVPVSSAEPASLMTGSKRVVHWTNEIWCESSEISGSPQGSPPAADYVGCEAGRRTCSECETGTEELCEIKWDYHIVGTNGLVMVRDEARLRHGHNDQSRRGHRWSETTLTGEPSFT